jgi:hypothetical protein
MIVTVNETEEMKMSCRYVEWEVSKKSGEWSICAVDEFIASERRVLKKRGNVYEGRTVVEHSSRQDSMIEAVVLPNLLKVQTLDAAIWQPCLNTAEG